MASSSPEPHARTRKSGFPAWRSFFGKLVTQILFGVVFYLLVPIFLSIASGSFDHIYYIILSVSSFIGPACISTAIYFALSLFFRKTASFYAIFIDIFVIFPTLFIHFHFFFTKSWPIISEDFPFYENFWAEIGNQTTVQILAASAVLRSMEHLALFVVRRVLRFTRQ